MIYNIQLEKAAIKFLQKQSKSQKDRIIKAIEKLPYIGDITPLKGYNNMYRLRVGDCRVIYRKEENKLFIVIINIDNRGDIYKRY